MGCNSVFANTPTGEEYIVYRSQDVKILDITDIFKNKFDQTKFKQYFNEQESKFQGKAVISVIPKNSDKVEEVKETKDYFSNANSFLNESSRSITLSFLPLDSEEIYLENQKEDDKTNSSNSFTPKRSEKENEMKRKIEHNSFLSIDSEEIDTENQEDLLKNMKVLAYFTTEVYCLFNWKKPNKINSNELQLKEKNDIPKTKFDREGAEFQENEIHSDESVSETNLSDSNDQSLNEILNRIADQINSLKLIWKKKS